MNEEEVSFFSETGSTVKAEEVIIPICHWDENQELKFIGTGFFMSQNIFVTAKHVLLNKLYTKAIENLVIISFSNGGWYYRNLTKVTAHNNSDVAIGIVSPIVRKDTGELITNKQMVIEFSDGELGEAIATYAYPLTTVLNKTDISAINVIPMFVKGEIIELFPTGRDSSMLPGPCFLTNMEILGGASGGPIFNKYGRVIAINSTGYDGEPLTFVSRIVEVFALKLHDIEVNNIQRSDITLFELAKLGHISVHNIKNIDLNTNEV